jgi:hypothetical protein
VPTPWPPSPSATCRTSTFVDPGHLTAYDVLAADRVVFTSHTVGAVGSSKGGYAVSDDDFVKRGRGRPKNEEGGEG